LVHGTQTASGLIKKFYDHHGGARPTLYRSRSAMGVESVDVLTRNGAKEIHWKLPERYKFRFYKPASQPLETETETAKVVVSNLISNPVSSPVSSRAKRLEETESNRVPQLVDSEVLEIANAPFLI